MSQNLAPQDPIRPLSIGNIVTAGLQIHRFHLKLYFSLALRANLWLLVPIYGWAKFFTIHGLISRLAFNEFIDQPESVEAGRSYVNPQKWNFLIAGLMVTVPVIGLLILATPVFDALTTIDSVAGAAAGSALLYFVIEITAALILWPFLICELPLAIETNITLVKAVKRSWKLTKGFVVRILGIIVVAFIITLPIEIAIECVVSLLQPSESASISMILLFTFFSFGLYLLGYAFTSPIWQAIVAVLYYDLRNRQEGLGLQLRNQQVSL